MATKAHMFIQSLVVVISLTFLLSGAVSADMDHNKGGRHDMGMHHMHTMLNHSLGMALEGSKLIMLGQMGMSPGMDKESIEHGKMMIKNARQTWTEAIEGKTMKEMHSGGAGMTNPMMAYTHQLAEAQLKVMDVLEKMSPSAHEVNGMGMHHMHIMLNHALKMALEGSDLVMIGQMGMAPGMDKDSIEHGKMMMKNARQTWTETIEGKAMKNMHSGGAGMTNPRMAYTHELAEAQLKVIDLLEKTGRQA